jgi:cobalt-zinc-cadmium efflux system membrane fusion protein
MHGFTRIKMNRVSLFFAALCAVAVISGCGGAAVSQSQAPQPSAGDDPNVTYVASDAAGIQTITTQTSTINDYLEIPAQIQPDPTEVVHVFPPAGGRIVEMKVRPWDWVQKGQTLATLESGDLSRAVADYHKAEADNRMKQQQFARATDLFTHNAIALKDLQQAQADAQSAQAEMEDTAEQVRVFGMDPDHATAELLVAAPRAGVVLDVGASPGEYSNALAAAQPLCTIADISTVWAVGDIYESDLPAAKIGAPAQLTLNAYPGQQWSGRIGVVSDAVDPNTRTLHVRLVLPNPGAKLKPAMFGSIRLLRATRRGIVLPSAAVLREGNAAYAYVAIGAAADRGRGQGRQGARYQRRDVTAVASADGSVEITSGLKPGDTVVSQGALLLRPSTSGD